MTQSGLFDVGEWLLAQDCLSPKLRGGPSLARQVVRAVPHASST